MKQITELFSDKWPKSIESELICGDKNEDRESRARAILYNITEGDIQSPLLDFGCGDGSLIKEAKKLGIDAIGYDIHGSYSWDEIVKNSPYKTIIVHDVLDHLEEENLVSVMKKIKSVTHSRGIVFARCHPFTSRYGTHHLTLNKAYAHLFFSNEELNNLGHQGLHTSKIEKAEYEDAFKDAGFNINFCLVTKEDIEEFFDLSPKHEIQFIDYWLNPIYKIIL